MPIFSKKILSDFFSSPIDFFHRDIGICLLKYVNKTGEYGSLIFNWEKKASHNL